MSTAEGVRQDIRINFPVNFRRISKSWQTTGTKRRTARRKEIQLISARKIGSFFPREPSRHPSLLAFSSASPANPIDSSFFEQFAPNTDPRCYNSSMLLSNSLCSTGNVPRSSLLSHSVCALRSANSFEIGVERPMPVIHSEKIINKPRILVQFHVSMKGERVKEPK